MTKKIKDFGIPIGGGRKNRKDCVSCQDDRNMTKNHVGGDTADDHSYADRVKEEQGAYYTQGKAVYNRKKQLKIPKLTSIHRTGPEYLPNGKHAGENDFNAIGIRGVEFGACLTDKEAQVLLDECYVAFCDLARVLKLDLKDVSLGGTLSLSFGSRGHGGSGTAAYDPKYHVINFTRDGGAGSLAHEWAHALDYFIGQSCGLGRSGFEVPVSEGLGIDGVPPSVTDLLRRMVYKREARMPEEQMQMAEENHARKIREEEARCEEILGTVTPENLTDEQRKAWQEAVREVYDTRRWASLDMYVLRNYPNKAIEELSRVHKEITGHGIPKDKRRRINYAFTFLAMEEELPIDTRGLEWKDEDTEFYKNSWEIDKRYAKTIHGRYSDHCERMARAFEGYVADKLEKEGNQSQYLTAHTEDVVFVREDGDRVYGVPRDKEREEINRKFDVVFQELKEMGILHWGNIDKNVELLEEREDTALEIYKIIGAGGIERKKRKTERGLSM